MTEKLDITTDCYYEVGDSHEICEDYALAGKLKNGIRYAIISDGCSSSDFVDVGARIMCHCAQEFLKMYYGRQKKFHYTDNLIEFSKAFQNYIISSAFIVGKQLGLSVDFLDCTLVLAISDGFTTRAFIYGDGGIIVKFYNGDIHYESINFSSNAPFYLSYQLDHSKLQNYINAYGNHSVSIILDSISNREYKQNKTILYDKPSDFMSFIYTTHVFTRVQSISVVSDGIHSYLDIDSESNISEPTDHMTMVKKFTAFKNFKGSFVKRRMNRIKRDCKNNNQTHYDDISIATINIPEDENVANSDGKE